jgi:hypothetical protein
MPMHAIQKHFSWIPIERSFFGDQRWSNDCHYRALWNLIIVRDAVCLFHMILHCSGHYYQPFWSIWRVVRRHSDHCHHRSWLCVSLGCNTTRHDTWKSSCDWLGFCQGSKLTRNCVGIHCFWITTGDNA